VSGRITSMLPLPRATRGLSVVIAEKLLFSEVTESCGVGPLLVLELELEELLDGALLPQAATTSAALAAMAVAAAAFVTECKKTTSLMGGTCPIAGPCRAHDRSPLGQNLLWKP
jgi:hypothetical protein